MFRFTDGRLLIFDPPHLQEGFDGWYAIHGHVITIRDGGTRNFEGAIGWRSVSTATL
jgi:hypothetical protein